MYTPWHRHGVINLKSLLITLQLTHKSADIWNYLAYRYILLKNSNIIPIFLFCILLCPMDFRSKVDGHTGTSNWQCVTFKSVIQVCSI